MNANTTRTVPLTRLVRTTTALTPASLRPARRLTSVRSCNTSQPVGSISWKSHKRYDNNVFKVKYLNGEEGTVTSKYKQAPDK